MFLFRLIDIKTQESGVQIFSLCVLLRMYMWRCGLVFVYEEGLMGRKIISLGRCRINNIFMV